LPLFSLTAEREELEDNRVHNQDDEDDAENENDQPLDLTVKRSDAESATFIASIQRPLVVRERTSTFVENGLHGMEKAELVVSVSIQKENGIIHPKKRNWLKMEEEDDSFPHEIEEWKKTFTSGLCG